MNEPFRRDDPLRIMKASNKVLRTENTRLREENAIMKEEMDVIAIPEKGERRTRDQNLAHRAVRDLPSTKKGGS